ncbi:MAG: hypothetical protein KGI00_01525 [Candidatus Micrarchaeota archaeon]|nr:hypothetical protein [Candidatus Micrarchaeota archaeon]
MLKIIGGREETEILIFFLIVQFGGLLLADLAVSQHSLAIIKEGLVSNASIGISYTLDAMLILIVIYALVRRHRHHYTGLDDSRVFTGIEVVVLVITSYFAILFLLPSLFHSANLYIYYAISLVAAVLLTLLKEKEPIIRNTATTVSSIGIGLFLGVYLPFTWAIAFLFIVAVYDYLAVFVTKSMVKLAKAVDEKNIAFLIKAEDIEELPPSSMGRQELKAYLKYLHDSHEDENPIFRKILYSGNLPVMSRLELGEGDLDLPLMAVASSFFTYSNSFASIAIALFATIGLLVTMQIIRGYKKPLPAIPPLFSFIAIGTGIVFALFGYLPISLSLALVAVGCLTITFAMLRTFSPRKSVQNAPSPAG